MVQFSKPYFTVIILMLATYAVAVWLKAPPADFSNTRPLDDFPRQLGTWQTVEDGKINEATTRVLGANQTLSRKYAGQGGETVELVIIHFRDQGFEAQVHSPQHCLPGAGWEILRHREYRFDAKNSEDFATKLSVKKENDFQQIVYWFVTDNAVIQNEYLLKLHILKNRLFRRPTPVYFIRVIAAGKNGNFTLADQTLEDFFADAYDPLKKLGVF